jgi:dolichol kinase
MNENFPGRKNLQWGRRLFHMSMGTTVAALYGLFLDHHHAVALLGILACIMYVFEQVRINYPEYSEKFTGVMRLVYRAEERLKESAAVPYAIAVLLTIIIFPKRVAISAILTLAIADPMSAIIGIRFGRTRIVPHKSLEGSAAFFSACFLCIFLVFSLGDVGVTQGKLLAYSVTCAFLCSVVETLPLKIDDNLTIPIFTSITLFVLGALFGLNF